MNHPIRCIIDYRRKPNIARSRACSRPNIPIVVSTEDDYFRSNMMDLCMNTRCKPRSSTTTDSQRTLSTEIMNITISRNVDVNFFDIGTNFRPRRRTTSDHRNPFCSANPIPSTCAFTSSIVLRLHRSIHGEQTH
jgi:hypothetical protein